MGGAVALLDVIDNPPVNALSHPVRAARVSTAPPPTLGRAIRAAGRTFPAGADLAEFTDLLAASRRRRNPSWPSTAGARRRLRTRARLPLPPRGRGRAHGSPRSHPRSRARRGAVRQPRPPRLAGAPTALDLGHRGGRSCSTASSKATSTAPSSCSPSRSRRKKAPRPGRHRNSTWASPTPPPTSRPWRRRREDVAAHPWSPPHRRLHRDRAPHALRRRDVLRTRGLRGPPRPIRRAPPPLLRRAPRLPLPPSTAPTFATSAASAVVGGGAIRGRSPWRSSPPTARSRSSNATKARSRRRSPASSTARRPPWASGAEDRDRRLDNLRGALDYAALAELVEAVYEDLTAKQASLRRRRTPPRARSWPRHARRGPPRRRHHRARDVIGPPLLLPANVTLEIIVGAETAPDTVATALVWPASARSLSGPRSATASSPTASFSPTARPPTRMLEDGATIGQVDAAMRAFASPSGPTRSPTSRATSIAWPAASALPHRDPARTFFVAITTSSARLAATARRTAAAGTPTRRAPPSRSKSRGHADHRSWNASARASPAPSSTERSPAAACSPWSTKARGSSRGVAAGPAHDGLRLRLPPLVGRPDEMGRPRGPPPPSGGLIALTPEARHLGARGSSPTSRSSRLFDSLNSNSD